MENREYSRRGFFSKSLQQGSILLGSALLLTSCEQKDAKPEEVKNLPAKDFCNDFSGISKGELDKRQRFGYVDQSTVAESQCSSCSLYVPHAQQKHCGTCLLFQGPVLSSGYCIQYVPKV
ncbi:MAG: hypothetical protein WKF89_18040 [Chitinophagaceae bacterium]